jgi:hypothetical protein
MLLLPGPRNPVRGNIPGRRHKAKALSGAVELERIDAAAVKARDCRQRLSCLEVFRELLSTHSRRIRLRLPAETE